jgi:hypothetical protein
MDMNNTTTVVSRQHQQLLAAGQRGLYRFRMATKRKPMPAEETGPTPFNQRVVQAYALGEERGKFASQAELGRLLGCSQQNVSKLMAARSHGSTFTVRFANICGVSPLWLEAGEGGMTLNRASISDDAVLVAVAWQHMKQPLADRIAIDALGSALEQMRADDPVRRGVERMLKTIQKRRSIEAELGGTVPKFSRAPTHREKA